MKRNLLDNAQVWHKQNCHHKQGYFLTQHVLLNNLKAQP